jgi:hypothetical protein
VSDAEKKFTDFVASERNEKGAFVSKRSKEKDFFFWWKKKFFFSP